MRYIIALFLLVGLPACEDGADLPPNQDADTMPNFFSKFRADELGSTKIVNPSTLGMGNRGEPQKMLDLSVPDNLAAPLLISIRSEYSNNQSTVSQDGTIVGPSTGSGVSQLGAPIVATLQWGVGGARNEVSFDIPAPRLPATFFPTPAQQQENNVGNGVQIAISASHVSLYIRNDAWLGPLTNPAGDYTGSPSPAKVQAFVGPDGNANRPPLERTVFVAGGIIGPVPPATPLGIGLGALINPIPPFAKSVRFQRQPFNSPLTIRAFNNFGSLYREFTIPVNSEGPMPIDAQCQSISVTNTGAAAIDFLQAVFDVTP